MMIAFYALARKTLRRCLSMYQGVRRGLKSENEISRIRLRDAWGWNGDERGTSVPTFRGLLIRGAAKSRKIANTATSDTTVLNSASAYDLGDPAIDIRWRTDFALFGSNEERVTSDRLE